MTPLSRPLFTDNQQKQHMQILTEQTKRNAYKECLMEGDHQGQLIKGHLIPRSWLGKISAENQVVMFAQPPVNLFWSSSNKATETIRMGIGDAATGFFTCEGHEKSFFSIDATAPDLANVVNLNLMVYKATIAQLWAQTLMKKAYETLASKTTNDEVVRQIANYYTENERGLKIYAQNFGQHLSTDSCDKCNEQVCETIKHKRWVIPGEPALAVSQFTSGFQAKIDYHAKTVQKMVNWGLTVLPTNKGHVAILHYLKDEEHDLKGLFSNLFHAQGKKLAAELSVIILDNCENVAINPDYWDRLGSRRQQAITERFWTRMPEFGFETIQETEKGERSQAFPSKHVPNLQQLNLFRVS